MTVRSAFDGTDKSCGTCEHFRRTFPTSKRLADYGSCYWKLPKGIKLPASFTRHGVKAHEGRDCRAFEEKS